MGFNPWIKTKIQIGFSRKASLKLVEDTLGLAKN